MRDQNRMDQQSISITPKLFNHHSCSGTKPLPFRLQSSFTHFDFSPWSTVCFNVWLLDFFMSMATASKVIRVALLLVVVALGEQTGRRQQCILPRGENELDLSNESRTSGR